MERKNYFYGEHFEALGDIWSAIYGNVETFLKDYLEKSIKEGGVACTLQHKKGLFSLLLYPRKKSSTIA